jgi:hypothetical protein
MTERTSGRGQHYRGQEPPVELLLRPAYELSGNRRKRLLAWAKWKEENWAIQSLEPTEEGESTKISEVPEEVEGSKQLPRIDRSRLRLARDILTARHTILGAAVSAERLSRDWNDDALQEFFGYIRELKLELGTVWRTVIPNQSNTKASQANEDPETLRGEMLIDVEALEELQRQIEAMVRIIDVDKSVGFESPDDLEDIIEFFRHLRTETLPLNLSALDLRSLNFSADDEFAFWYDDVSGAIWTRETKWPVSIADSIYSVSEETSPGVYQVRLGTTYAMSRR